MHGMDLSELAAWEECRAGTCVVWNPEFSALNVLTWDGCYTRPDFWEICATKQRKICLDQQREAAGVGICFSAAHPNPSTSPCI